MQRIIIEFISSVNGVIGKMDASILIYEIGNLISIAGAVIMAFCVKEGIYKKNMSKKNILIFLFGGIYSFFCVFLCWTFYDNPSFSELILIAVMLELTFLYFLLKKNNKHEIFIK